VRTAGVLSAPQVIPWGKKIRRNLMFMVIFVRHPFLKSIKMCAPLNSVRREISKERHEPQYLRNNDDIFLLAVRAICLD
jgi:hypothetical protein